MMPGSELLKIWNLIAMTTRTFFAAARSYINVPVKSFFMQVHQVRQVRCSHGQHCTALVFHYSIINSISMQPRKQVFSLGYSFFFSRPRDGGIIRSISFRVQRQWSVRMRAINMTLFVKIPHSSRHLNLVRNVEMIKKLNHFFNARQGINTFF